MEDTAGHASNVSVLHAGCAHCDLYRLCLSCGLGEADLNRLDQIVSRRRAVERGMRLFRAGDDLSAIYVARDGAFKSVAVSEQGNEEILGFHLPGELIGLDAMGEGRHLCEAVALTNANVCQIPYAELSRIGAQIPALQHQLLRAIGMGVGRHHQHVGILLRRQASERIALFLHGISERYSKLGHSATQFRLPMSRDDIATFLGLALETVSRGFTRLQDDGVIAVHGRLIEILDIDALERIAHGEEDSEQTRPRAARA